MGVEQPSPVERIRRGQTGIAENVWKVGFNHSSRLLREVRDFVNLALFAVNLMGHTVLGDRREDPRSAPKTESCLNIRELTLWRFARFSIGSGNSGKSLPCDQFSYVGQLSSFRGFLTKILRKVSLALPTMFLKFSEIIYRCRQHTSSPPLLNDWINCWKCGIACEKGRRCSHGHQN